MQRPLTGALVQGVDLVIAMGQDHRAFVQTQFGLTAPLFNQVALDREEPVLDLHEALPDWANDSEGARAYVESVVEHI